MLGVFSDQVYIVPTFLKSRFDASLARFPSGSQPFPCEFTVLDRDLLSMRLHKGNVYRCYVGYPSNVIEKTKASEKRSFGLLCARLIYGVHYLVTRL